MTITLAKALVVSKQLGARIQELSKRFLANTTFTEKSAYDGTTIWKNYNPNQVFEELQETTAKSIAIRVLIDQANLPIREKILQLGEMKSWCKNLQSLVIQDSVRTSTRNPTTGFLEVTEIPQYNLWNLVQKNNKIDELRKQISNLQDELNTFNHQTTIELPFEV